MSEFIGNSFNVRKSMSTKNINIGDYSTLEEAQAEMIKHFENTPKRGKIEYVICEEELRDYNGTIMKVLTMSLSNDGKSNFYKRYTRAEIETMINEKIDSISQPASIRYRA